MSTARSIGYLAVVTGIACSIVEVMLIFGVHIEGTPPQSGYGLMLITVGLIAVAVDDIRKGKS